MGRPIIDKVTEIIATGIYQYVKFLWSIGKPMKTYIPPTMEEAIEKYKPPRS